jgi:hypothetical protein
MRASRSAVAPLVLLLALGCAATASAQADRDRVRISVDAGAQLSSIAFDATATKPVYLESAAIVGSYRIRRSVLAGGGVSIRLAGDVGVGVTVTSSMAQHDTDVSASVPHPFFFRTPRTVTGTAPGLRHDELTVHLQGIYTVRPSAKVDVAVSAGPSFFQVRQDVVTDIAFSDVYPYDTATYTSATTQRVSANKIGFNAGVDVGLRLSRHAGLGAGARFSTAKVTLTMPNGGAAVSTDTGGAQIAGGLRLYF